jgi:hypothetical protein
VKGQLSDVEAAALAVVLKALAARARAGRESAPDAGAASYWASHERALRTPPAPGPQAWRRSALPG